MRGVMAEVKTELLWMMKVIPAPISMARYPDSQPRGYGKSVEGNQETRTLKIDTNETTVDVL